MRRSVLLLVGPLIVVLLAGAAAPAGSSLASAADQGRRGAVPPVDGGLVRAFDPPANPYGAGHRGVDLAASPGELVRAALAGTVRFAGLVAGVGWVTLDHGGGLETTYGPIDPRLVARGERVRVGEVIGRLAEDHHHLDWGARLHGVYVDPLGLLVAWNPTLLPD